LIIKSHINNFCIFVNEYGTIHKEICPEVYRPRGFLIFYKMKIICKSCGTVNNYRTEKKANNLVAYCLICGHYIKNIPYSKPALHFGKFAGISIENYDTPEKINYLHWVRNHIEIWPKLNGRIQEAINLRLDGKL